MMFYCERCGTDFNAAASRPTTCPRCRADGVYSPLTFRLFDPAVIRKIGSDPRPGRVQRRRGIEASGSR